MKGILALAVVCLLADFIDAQVIAWVESGFTVTAGTGTASVTMKFNTKVVETSTDAYPIVELTVSAYSGVDYAFTAAGNPGSVGNFANKNSGSITLASGKFIDYETTKSIVFVVTATPGAGTVGTATVTVEIKNKIEYSNTHYVGFVADKAAAGTTVGTYAVADKAIDDTIVYTISPTTHFEYGATTGVVSVKTGATIDMATAGGHTLTLTATPAVGGSSATTADTATLWIAVGICSSSALQVTANFTGETCEQCLANFVRVKCAHCSTGMFGTYCEHDCTRCTNGHCDLSGSCISGCKDGYWKSDCSLACNDNCTKCSQYDGGCQLCATDVSFGPKCEFECDIKCINRSCSINGDCNQGCSINSFGPKCDKPCPNNCYQIHESAICSQEDASCKVGCKDGYRGSKCEEVSELKIACHGFDVDAALIGGGVGAVLCLTGMGIVLLVRYAIKRRRDNGQSSLYETNQPSNTGNDLHVYSGLNVDTYDNFVSEPV